MKSYSLKTFEVIKVSKEWKSATFVITSSGLSSLTGKQVEERLKEDAGL